MMMTGFNLKQVKITGGHLRERMDINSSATIENIYKVFKESGRFDAIKLKKVKDAHIFWDSDIAKWLESAAYILSEKDDCVLRERVNEAIEDIINNQRDDGYYNSYFMVHEPEAIFTRRTDHELYCFGHIFEAAQALSFYLGDDRLLDFSSKATDYITKRFVINKDTAFITPGHEEIELALFKLYQLTKEQKYFDLMSFFLEQRGKTKETLYEFCDLEYSQSHLEIRNQHTAEGHSVRALYLYIAMADYSIKTGDDKIKEALTNIFTDIIKHKMYITGGTGSAFDGERFTFNYDLPNYMAYSETCAGIALAMLCDRMQKLSGDKIFGDVFERTLYNIIPAGVSQDGKSFFYINPLEMRIDDIKFNSLKERPHYDRPIAKRLELFSCSCCPPNISRFYAQLPTYIYYADNNGLTISQFITSKINYNNIKIDMTSDFPYSGKVSLNIACERAFKLRMREPEWAQNTKLNVNGGKEEVIRENGYIILDIEKNQTKIQLDFCISLRENFSSPSVIDNQGLKALSYGALILCAEAIDNAQGLNAIKPSVKNYKISQGNIFNIEVDAKRQILNDELYSFNKLKEVDCTLKLIPYASWANREATDMKIWFVQ